MTNKIRARAKHLSAPGKMGSYSEDDCVFLLKNINNLIKEQENSERESLMQRGVHYSEMLPVEYYPTEEYIEVFKASLKEQAEEIARHVAYVSELIIKERGSRVVLVSLARAGAPIGVLIKRYLKKKYDLNIPHYSVSIVRGKGIDENALCYMIDRYGTDNLQFIDGWTGKGAIAGVLKEAIADFNEKYEVNVSDELAVLADPSQCVSTYGTREDYLIPSACLNSTVSGLVSRTVCREDLVGPNDFHGAKFYQEWADVDFSNEYVDIISAYFEKNFAFDRVERGELLHTGMKEVETVKQLFGIEDINKIKPGIGETTRVLLRRVPWKILVKDMNSPKLKHILMLAENKNVPVEVFTDMNYECMGLIEEVKA